MELGLPLALRLVQRVCGQGVRQVGGGGRGEGWGMDMGRGCECRRMQGERRQRGMVERIRRIFERCKTRGRMRVETGRTRMAGRRREGEKMTGRQG